MIVLLIIDLTTLLLQVTLRSVHKCGAGCAADGSQHDYGVTAASAAGAGLNSTMSLAQNSDSSSSKSITGSTPGHTRAHTMPLGSSLAADATAAGEQAVVPHSSHVYMYVFQLMSARVCDV